MDALDVLSKYGLEVLNRYYGVMPGVVLDNSDADLSGRLQIGISGTSLGPMVEVTAIPLSMGGGDGFGVRWPLPKRGSVVNVLFKEGNLTSAYWTYSGWQSNNAPVEFKDANSWGIISPLGNKILITRTKEGKESLNIKFSGPVTIESSESVSIKSPVNSLTPTGDGGFNSLGDSDAGGWAVATKLAERLNLLVQEIKELKQELAIHTHTASPSGGPTSPPSVPLMSDFTEFQGSTFVDPNNIS